MKNWIITRGRGENKNLWNQTPSQSHIFHLLCQLFSRNSLDFSIGDLRHLRLGLRRSVRRWTLWPNRDVFALCLRFFLGLPTRIQRMNEDKIYWKIVCISKETNNLYCKVTSVRNYGGYNMVIRLISAKQCTMAIDWGKHCSSVAPKNDSPSGSAIITLKQP